MKLNGSVIKIEPLGSEPYSSYRIIFNIKTIISTTPTYQNRTVCILELPERFPVDMPRLHVAEGSKPPWHVNWYTGGTWCAGDWNAAESLVNYIYRCAKILQFDTVITNPGNPANKDAIPFWNANKSKPEVIPCDRQTLPTADAPPKISILNTAKPKIITKSGN
jgi:hypothetical protein